MPLSQRLSPASNNNTSNISNLGPLQKNDMPQLKLALEKHKDEFKNLACYHADAKSIFQPR